MAKETQGKPEKMTYIKCVCGNKVFIPGVILGPGKKKPAVLKHVYMCAGCGMTYEADDFPKKGEEEERRESKILLPGNRKLKLVD